MKVIHSIKRPARETTIGGIYATFGISRVSFYNLFDSKIEFTNWHVIPGDRGQPVQLVGGVGSSSARDPANAVGYLAIQPPFCD